MRAVQEVFPTIVLDRMIRGGCSKRRPDGLLDCGTHSVVVEIDEDQHSSYDATCENRRSMEIFQDLQSRPLVLVRLNPDSYVSDGGRRIPGAFTVTKASKELRKNEAEFARRLERLLCEIRVASEAVPSRDVAIISLFFDATESA